MSSDTSGLVHCYNKGCGNKFYPNENTEDSCTFHPGNPVFHDSYKGWSCCNKKCTDFTEFLNIKGCTTSFHSNVKPPEPEKRVVDKSKASEVIEYKALTPKASLIKRPPFETPLKKMVPTVSSRLTAEMENITVKKTNNEVSGEITVGTTCKNRGCKASYQGPQSMDDDCKHHPGVPVFHEGLKYWSCCCRKTTEFASFLEQAGCETGTHMWLKEEVGNSQVACRYDWHQTGSYTVISVYAKKYDPLKSTVELNPIRSKIHLYFPQENSSFDVDFELFGVIDVEKSQVEMLPTKVEVKMKKAEPESWAKLELPKAQPPPVEKPKEEEPSTKVPPDVDLSNLS